MTTPAHREFEVTQIHFTHDCDKCRFLGHFADHDVYLCHGQDDRVPSIIARYGDEGPDYASGPLDVVFQGAISNSNIGIIARNPTGDFTLPWHEYFFSKHVAPSTKAMALAILANAPRWQIDLLHLNRKVAHGCTDASCPMCDGR